MATGETRSFLIQFLAETGDAVTAMNFLGRSMQKFPSQAINAAAQTEVAMAEVDTALRQAGVSASHLSDAFTSMGRDATAMLKAAGAAAKIGFEGEDNLKAFAETARRFGFVTKTSTEQAGQALSDLGVAMGYKTPEQIERLASGMTELSRRTNVTYDDLTALMKRTGPLSNAIGVSESAVMALAASFSQQNMSAKAAAGPISNLMEMMQYSALSGHQLGKAVGLSGDKFDEFAKAIPDKQIEMFMGQIGKMGKIQAEQTLHGLGIASGLSATQIWLAAKQTQNFTKYIGWASEGMKKNTALKREAYKVERTLTFQMKELGKQSLAFLQMTGKMLVPVVRVFVQALRGLLFVLMVIPRPVLALAAAFAALGAAILAGTWAAKTKLVAGSVTLIATIYREIAAVGGLAGAYKVLTSAQAAQALVQAAADRRRTIAGLKEAKLPLPTKSVGMGFGVAGAPTGAMGAMVTVSAALGISVAALIGIVLALVAVFILMGVMIYKGVKMMQEGTAKAKVFGAALLLMTGPIGLFVLGMMALAKPIRDFKDQVVAAFEPIIPILEQIAPLLYAIGAALAVVMLIMSPITYAILFILGFIYAIMPIIVGFIEGFAEVLAFAIEPFLPGLKALGDLFEWVGEKIGMTGVSAGWLTTLLKIVGKTIAYSIIGPFALAVRFIAVIFDGIRAYVDDFWGSISLLGEAIEMVWEGVVAAFQWAVGKMVAAFAWVLSPIVKIKVFFTSMIGAMVAGIARIVGPLKAVAGFFYSIYQAASSVKTALVGSSPWHVEESMGGEVIPALERTRGAFDDVAEASFGATPQVARVREGAEGARAAASVAAASAMRVPAQAPQAPQAAGGGAREVRVSIPVVVQLDGVTLGRTVIEQIIELNERNMNPPGFPMRGVEPAFG